jgi:hypothetical protein
METGFDKIRKLLDHLISIGFWDRLFGWKKTREWLAEANEEFQKILSRNDLAHKLQHELELERNNFRNLQNSVVDLKTEIGIQKESLLKAQKEKEILSTSITSLESKNAVFLERGMELKQRSESLEKEIGYLRDELTKYKTAETERMKKHQGSIDHLDHTVKRIEDERNAEKHKQHLIELERIRKLKETWSSHEASVQSSIKRISARHGVDYADKIPFKGKPDNTLKINNEYIIFDAKSPANDDLSNFPNYIKNQAESASKYVREEDVRREIFLVVPTNTLEILDQFEYKLSDYTVYIISLDSLEPIILALRKIEDYEFAEQLSPEERENICRVIGKFVHLSKRRIQIDGFFAKQFFELVYRSEADLPKDILEKVVEFERSEKLNPPIEKRARQISAKELEADVRQLKSDAEQKGINTEDAMLSKNINKLPLYAEPKVQEDQPKLF